MLCSEESSDLYIKTNKQPFHKSMAQHRKATTTGQDVFVHVSKGQKVTFSTIHASAQFSVLPFVPLAGLVIAVGLVFRVLLVDTVVGQVHELITQSLHGRRIPRGVDR